MYRLTSIKEALLDILFPPVCLHCKKNLAREEKSKMLCGDCAAQIHIHATLFCAKCRARLPDNKKICHKDTPYMLAAAVNYDGSIKDLIHQLKYRRWTSVIDVIRPILDTYVKNLSLSVDDYLIIPIPLHPDRQKERGFNQAELISAVIAEALQLSMPANILTRVKKTKAQAELKNYNDRSENLANAFHVTNGEIIKNKNIILVDDVYTSGATMDDAARALREAGVKKIIAFTFAKTR